MGKAIGYFKFQSPRTHTDLKNLSIAFRHTSFITSSLFIQISNTEVGRYSANSGHFDTGSKRVNENGAESFHKLPQEIIPYVHNSRSGKPLKDISERRSKADLHPIYFLVSSEVTLTCGAQNQVRNKPTHPHQEMLLDISDFNLLGLI